jgi:hypothetical protein
MSKLYTRVRTGFYTHRKTARLRSKIGDDAYWIPPRLWAYAAENQPDGDLSGYSSEELSELIGCPKYATSILQALLDAGFLDPDLKIHGWAEHNGYHEKFAERAKKAASARWEKEKSSPGPPTEIGNRKGERGDKHCLEHACSIGSNDFPEAAAPSDPYKLPQSINSPAIQDAWRKWLEHLKQLRKTPTIISAEAQIKALESMGPERALKAILHSITANWQSIHEPDIKSNQKNSTTPPQHVDRSIGTANEGLAARYKGLGRVGRVAQNKPT